MEEKTKQRLIGVLVLIGALFIILPFLFHNSRPSLKTSITAQSAAATPAVSLALPADSATTAQTTAQTTPAAVPAVPAPAATVTIAQTAMPATSTAQPAAKPAVKQTQSATPASSLAGGFTPDQAVSPSSGLTTGQHVGSLASDSSLQAATQTQQASLAETSAAMSAAPAPRIASKPVVRTVRHPIVKNNWHVQLAVFSDKKNAEVLMRKLRMHHFEAYTHDIIRNHRRLIAVMVGPEANEHSALLAQRRLKNEFRLNGVVRKTEA